MPTICRFMHTITTKLSPPAGHMYILQSIICSTVKHSRLSSAGFLVPLHWEHCFNIHRFPYLYHDPLHYSVVQFLHFFFSILPYYLVSPPINTSRCAFKISYSSLLPFHPSNTVFLHPLSGFQMASSHIVHVSPEDRAPMVKINRVF